MFWVVYEYLAFKLCQAILFWHLAESSTFLSRIFVSSHNPHNQGSVFSKLLSLNNNSNIYVAYTPD